MEQIVYRMSAVLTIVYFLVANLFVTLRVYYYKTPFLFSSQPGYVVWLLALWYSLVNIPTVIAFFFLMFTGERIQKKTSEYLFLAASTYVVFANLVLTKVILDRPYFAWQYILAAYIIFNIPALVLVLIGILKRR